MRLVPSILWLPKPPFSQLIEYPRFPIQFKASASSYQERELRILLLTKVYESHINHMRLLLAYESRI
jgi:hypothetical protein